jgi:hypothetical protein
MASHTLKSKNAAREEGKLLLEATTSTGAGMDVHKTPPTKFREAFFLILYRISAKP